MEILNKPEHGSWLSMTVMELIVLTSQALSGRIPDLEILRRRVMYGKSNEIETPRPLAGASKPKTLGSS
jgi:hypothetical protein